MDRPRLMPEDTPDAMTQAWADCLRWSIGRDDILDSFIEEKDLNADSVLSGEIAIGDSYILWFNEHIWGPIQEHWIMAADTGDAIQ